MSDRTERAVVLGASMSGLLSAAVLADFYGKVTVVERDVLPDGPKNRHGVPQGTHTHVLMPRGSQIFDELFPGILDELAAGGVPVWSDGDLSKVHISVWGHSLLRAGRLRDPMANAAYYASRPFLEDRVRRRLLSVPNIEILDGYDIAAPTANVQGDRVTGARVVNRSTGVDTTLTTDLLVDATGRGSRTPGFLADLGYGRPPEDELTVRLAYVSQHLRIPPGLLTQNIVSIFPEPGRPTAFALVRCENDTWILTLGAMVGSEPPSRPAEILAFLEKFAPADVVAAVRAAEEIGEVTRYHVPSNRWRRYDKMRRFPNGLLIVGDAICSFNPIYGQGMTVAALEALTLRDCLRRGQRDLSQRFFRASAKPIGAAWRTAVGSDLALPEVVGPRSMSMRMTNAYLERVLRLAETDPVVAEQFLRVIGMIDPPTALVGPSGAIRIAKALYRRRTSGPAGLEHSVTADTDA